MVNICIMFQINKLEMKKVITLMTFFLLIGCNKNKQEVKIKKDEFFKSNYFSEERIKKDKYEVKYKGDWRSYSELELYYSYNKKRKIELLPYSLLMVEKHKQFNYCKNVFENILEFYSEKEFRDYYNGENSSLINYLKNVELLNIDQKNYAIYFLKLGANNNDNNCILYLDILYRNGIGVEKNLKKADSLKIILEKNNFEKK